MGLGRKRISVCCFRGWFRYSSRLSTCRAKCRSAQPKGRRKWKHGSPEHTYHHDLTPPGPPHLPSRPLCHTLGMTDQQSPETGGELINLHLKNQKCWRHSFPLKSTILFLSYCIRWGNYENISCQVKKCNGVENIYCSVERINKGQ